MPLTIAPINVVLRVIKILADGKLKKHLESLGITVDTDLKVHSCVNGNPVIEVKAGRLALDRDIASKIWITVI